MKCNRCIFIRWCRHMFKCQGLNGIKCRAKTLKNSAHNSKEFIRKPLIELTALAIAVKSVSFSWCESKPFCLIFFVAFEFTKTACEFMISKPSSFLMLFIDDQKPKMCLTFVECDDKRFICCSRLNKSWNSYEISHQTDAIEMMKKNRISIRFVLFLFFL